MALPAASLAAAVAADASSRWASYAEPKSTQRAPSTRNTSTAAGISMSTLPRSSPTAGPRIEAVDAETAAERVDHLAVTGRRRQHSAAEGPEPRDGDERHVIGDRRRHRLAP